MQNINNVRLTDEAHALLKEKATNLGQSMKEVVSEAVISLFKRELKYNEYIAQADRLKERIKDLQKTVRDSNRHADGMFILGAVVSGCLMFFVGVLW